MVQALTPAIRLDLVPKSSIDVYVNVLENDGTSSSLAAAISAASVALADAGIEMYDQVAASSIVSNKRSGLSLSKAIEQKLNSRHEIRCLGLCPRQNSDGSFSS